MSLTIAPPSQTLEELQRDLTDVLSHRADVQRELTLLQEQMVTLNQMEKNLRDKIVVLELQEMEKTGGFDWRKIITEAANGPMLYYLMAKDVAKEYGMGVGGHWQQTSEIAFETKLHKHDNARTQRAQAFIETTLPYFTPIEGWVYYEVSTKDNNLHAIYTLQVNPTTLHAQLDANRWGNHTIEMEGTLDQVLRYCQDNHYVRKIPR